MIFYSLSRDILMNTEQKKVSIGRTRLAQDLQEQIEYLHTYLFIAKYRLQIEKEGVIHLLKLKCIKSTPVTW